MLNETDKTVLWCINFIEEMLDKVQDSDWHDEWKIQVEDASEMRECLDTVKLTLIKCPGMDRMISDSRK